jgi:citrate lyase beta subunit
MELVGDNFTLIVARYHGNLVTPHSRQPVHTVYGGAHLFKSATCPKLGELARRAMSEFAPVPATLANALGIRPDIADTVYARVAEKLRREPVEDFRIDFEDGFGVRSEEEEDAAADATAVETARGLADGTLPPFFGIRIKRSGCRTLQRFLTVLLSKTGGRLPDNFVVTLPKITAAEQVAALVKELEPFPGVRIEIMIETPQSIFLLPQLVQAAGGKCVAAHFGAYDYTAGLGITAACQDLRHPACDFARQMMLASLAGTGIQLADGATNILPIAAQGRASVHAAWKAHYDNIRHSLYSGFYQSWDLHPAQLPARYAAVYAFFLEGLAQASERLRNFVAQSARATEAGGVFDDAATVRGLVNYFLRAVDCGAVPESEVRPLLDALPS